MPRLSKAKDNIIRSLDAPNLLNGYRGNSTPELHTPERERILKQATQLLDYFPNQPSRQWAISYLKTIEINKLIREGLELTKKERQFRDSYQEYFSPTGKTNHHLSHSIEKFTNEARHWHGIFVSTDGRGCSLEKFKYDKKPPQEVFKAFEEQHTKYVEQQRDERQGRDIKLQGDEKLILKSGNLYLFNLERADCTQEGDAMAHCGNIASTKDQLMLSVRTKREGGRYRPHATIILNEVVRAPNGNILSAKIGEIKGYSNSVVKEEYRGIIAELIASNPFIKGKIVGDYAPEVDLRAPDFTDEDVAKIASGNPDYFTPAEIYYKFRDVNHPIFIESVVNYAKKCGFDYDPDSKQLAFSTDSLDKLKGCFEIMAGCDPVFKDFIALLDNHADHHSIGELKYGAIVDCMKNFGLTNVRDLLYVTTAVGLENITEHPPIKEALATSKQNVSDMTIDIWQLFKKLQSACDLPMIEINNGKATWSDDLCERFAQSAKENISAAEQNPSNSRALYAMDMNPQNILNRQPRFIEDIQKVADRGNPTFSQTFAQIHRRLESAITDPDEPQSLKSVLAATADKIEMNRPSSQLKNMICNPQNIIDVEGNIALYACDHPIDLTLHANRSIGRHSGLQGIHEALKSGIPIPKVLVIGKLDGAGGIEPMSTMPMSANGCVDIGMVKRTKLLAAGAITSSDAFNSVELIGRNIKTLTNWISDDSKPTTIDFLRNIAPKTMGIEIDSEQPKSLGVLYLAGAMYSSCAIQNGSGDKIIDLFGADKLDTALSDFQSKLILKSTGLSSENITDELAASGIYGAAASEHIPRGAQEAGKLLSSTARLLAREMHHKWGDPIRGEQHTRTSSLPIEQMWQKVVKKNNDYNLDAISAALEDAISKEYCEWITPHLEALKPRALKEVAKIALAEAKTESVVADSIPPEHPTTPSKCRHHQKATL